MDSSLRPDVIVRCGPMMPGATSLDDPTILFEVWSAGSVERDRPVVEVFDRAGEARSTQRLTEGLDAALDLSSLDLSIPLAEIYRDVLKPGA